MPETENKRLTNDTAAAILRGLLAMAAALRPKDDGWLVNEIARRMKGARA